MSLRRDQFWKPPPKVVEALKRGQKKMRDGEARTGDLPLEKRKGRRA